MAGLLDDFLTMQVPGADSIRSGLTTLSTEMAPYIDRGAEIWREGIPAEDVERFLGDLGTNLSNDPLGTISSIYTGQQRPYTPLPEPTASPPAQEPASEEDKLVTTVDQAANQSGSSPNYDGAKAKADKEGRQLTPEEATFNLSKDQHGAGKAFLATQGDTEEQGFWDEFADTYDLTTFGLNMMALSGRGDLNFTQKMALSMQAGREAKVAQHDKGIAAQAAGREEAREERKIALDEAVARQNAVLDSAQLQLDQQKEKIDSLVDMSTYNLNIAKAKEKLNDIATAGGANSKFVDNKSLIEATGAALKAARVEDPEAVAPAIITNAQKHYREAASAGIALQADEALDLAIQDYLSRNPSKYDIPWIPGF
jgi:hypothetical protein